jgi:hypothetical protein
VVGYDHVDYVRAAKPSMSGAPARFNRFLEPVSEGL